VLECPWLTTHFTLAVADWRDERAVLEAPKIRNSSKESLIWFCTLYSDFSIELLYDIIPMVNKGG
jgi:hypothetical protein